MPQRNGSCLVKLVSPSPFLKNLDFLPFWLFFRHNKWENINSRQNKLFLLSGLSLVIVWAFHLSFPSFQSVIRDSPNVAMSGFHPIALSIYYIYIHNQQLIHLIFNSGYTIYYIYIIHSQSSSIITINLTWSEVFNVPNVPSAPSFEFPRLLGSFLLHLPGWWSDPGSGFSASREEDGTLLAAPIFNGMPPTVGTYARNFGKHWDLCNSNWQKFGFMQHKYT